MPGEWQHYSCRFHVTNSIIATNLGPTPWRAFYDLWRLNAPMLQGGERNELLSYWNRMLLQPDVVDVAQVEAAVQLGNQRAAALERHQQAVHEHEERVRERLRAPGPHQHVPQRPRQNSGGEQAVPGGHQAVPGQVPDQAPEQEVVELEEDDAVVPSFESSLRALGPHDLLPDLNPEPVPEPPPAPPVLVMPEPSQPVLAPGQAPLPVPVHDQPTGAMYYATCAILRRVHPYLHRRFVSHNLLLDDDGMDNYVQREVLYKCRQIQSSQSTEERVKWANDSMWHFMPGARSGEPTPDYVEGHLSTT